MLTFAIIGRPNVGKSTFFNKLVGKKKAIVSNFYGITQDRQNSIGNIAGLQFKIIDTAGIDKTDEKNNANDYFFQTKEAIKECDFIFFVIDLSSGILPFDYSLAKLIKKSGKEVILIGNKVDIKSKNYLPFEEEKLGFKNIVFLSSEHKIGFNNLFYKINDLIKKKYGNKNLNENENDIIKVSFIGKPNTGKSTLINYILGEKRLITSQKSGQTRDSIEVKFIHKSKEYILIDTAGIRRKSNITNLIEKYSVSNTFNEIKKSDICVLLIDANDNINKQDLLISNKVLEFGKGLIIVLNKWDSVKNKIEIRKKFLARLKKSLTQIKEINLNTISGLNGDGVPKLLDEISKIHNRFGNRVETNVLNKFFKYIVEKTPPPLVNGKKNALKYITQVKSKPPTFILFCAYPNKISKSYIRFIQNSLRESYNFQGMQIKILLRKSDNPYSNK